MVEEQRIEERAQAVKRLRSLFDTHKVVYGAPVNLRGMLLNLHHDRRFSMEFWSVVNTFSEGAGGGSLTEEQMFEAILESVTGVTSGSMPPYERPAVIELGQMLGGIDLDRPAEESLEPVLPPVADSAAPPQQSMVAGQPASADRASEISEENDPDSGDRRRSIADALARLEQTTRELREQLAQMEGHGEASADLPSAIAPEAFSANIPPAMPSTSEPAPVIHVEPPPFEATSEPLPHQRAAASEPPIEHEVEDEQSGSPLAEALPPHRFIDVVTPEPRAAAPHIPEPKRVEPRVEPVVAARPPRVPAAEDEPIEPGPLSSPLEQIRPPAPATSSSTSIPVAPATSAPKVTPPEPAIFEPKPAHKLSQRGLAVPPPLAEDEINANPPSFGRYGEEPEPSSKSGLVTAVLLLVLLGGGAYVGVATEPGRTVVASARQWVQDTYSKLTGHNDESSVPASSTSQQPPATAPDTSTPSSPAPTPTTNAAAPSTTANVPSPAPTTATPARPTPSAEGDIEIQRPRRQPFVDDSVLRVSSSVMSGNLVSSRAPVYPPAALSQQVEGVVNLDVVVGSNGLVKFAKAIDGDRLLQAAAEEAVLRWRYKPYILNGEPVSVSTTVQVRFRLPEE